MKRIVTALLLLTALAGAVDTLSVPIGPVTCIQKDGLARLLARFDLSALPRIQLRLLRPDRRSLRHRRNHSHRDAAAHDAMVARERAVGLPVAEMWW